MPCLPVPPRNPFRIGIPVAAAPAAALGGTSLDEVSPAATAMVAAPGPDPVTADKVATLERNVIRLRRDLDRMARVMALLEHDLAIERITTTQPTVLDKLGAWLADWASWLSPWTPRARPRMQRPLA